jgi:ubiquinone/menaquinone biosynthesis C-methylase UbiE
MVQMSRSHQGIVQKQFTKTADAFTEFAVRDEPEVLAEKLEFVKPQHTDFSLDVACGPGAFVLALAPRVRFVRGLDLTEELLRRARQLQLEHNILNAAFDRGEAEQLPYPSAVFDLVTCLCALHHMSRPAVALREIVRVMKAEGRLAVIDTLSPESDSKFELHNLIERTRDPSHTLALRLTTFLEIFENLGLEIAHRKSRKDRYKTRKDFRILIQKTLCLVPDKVSSYAFACLHNAPSLLFIRQSLQRQRKQERRPA